MLFMLLVEYLFFRLPPEAQQLHVAPIRNHAMHQIYALLTLDVLKNGDASRAPTTKFL